MNVTPTFSVAFSAKLNILTPLKLILLNILLCIVFFDCNGQVQAKITQPQLTLVNDSLIINYNILDANPDERFDIRLEITDNNGVKINAATLTGDIGDSVKGGVNKEIIWNLAADSIFLNTSINVEIIAKKIVILKIVTQEKVLTEIRTVESKEEEDLDEIPADEGIEKDIAEARVDQSKKEDESAEIPANESKEEIDQTETTADEVTEEDISVVEESHKVIEESVVTSPKVKAGKHILQSTIFPGWGLTELNKGKPYWLIGVAGTGCIASSIYFNRKADLNYNNYLDSNDRVKSDTYYDNAKTQNNISKALAYTAAAIWVTDLVIVAIKASNMNKSYKKNSLSAFSVGSYIESNTDTPMLSLYFNF